MVQLNNVPAGRKSVDSARSATANVKTKASARGTVLRSMVASSEGSGPEGSVRGAERARDSAYGRVVEPTLLRNTECKESCLWAATRTRISQFWGHCGREAMVSASHYLLVSTV